jgi:hypothetical protein
LVPLRKSVSKEVSMKRLIVPISALLTLLVITLSGCGSSTGVPPPVVRLLISPNSATLYAGQTQQFTVSVTGTSETAVTWGVTGCTGTGCGTITSTGLYTAPSLIPSAVTVTVVATLQSDSTKSGTAAVNQVPVSVHIQQTAVSLSATQTYQFTANVTGTSNTAVTWGISGCTGTACGTVSSTGLYTAPSLIPTATTATVTATSNADPTKSDSATVSQVPLTVQIPETDVSLGVGQTHQFTAVVTGHPNTAVTWSISGCTGAACGTITQTGMYTAPSSIPADATVTVIATSQADPTKSATVAVHHMCLDISITPAGPVTVAAGATLNLTATESWDINNAGVTWALSGTGCSGATCGTLSNVTNTSVTYTAPTTLPNPPTVTLTATSITDTCRTAAVTITVSTAPPLQEGDYAFFFNGWEIHFSTLWYTQYRVAVAGHFHADTSGNITDGVEDVNAYSGVSLAVPFTGTYSIGPDRRGSLTLGNYTYHLTVNSAGDKGCFIKDNSTTDPPMAGGGCFALQDKSAFSLAGLAGPYAMAMFGDMQEITRITAVGRFTADIAGNFSNGMMDAAVATNAGGAPQNNYPNITLTGSFGAPSSSTGRGTATITLGSVLGTTPATLNFVYYVISNQRILLVQSDTRSSNIPVLSGEARRQTGSFSPAAFNAPSIFNLAGVNNQQTNNPMQTATIGQMVPDGSGSITGTIDQNAESSVTLNQALTGSYSLDSSGRSVMTLQLGSAGSTQVAYFIGQNQGFLMQTSGTDVLLGSFKPQSGGPFTGASLSGTFLTNSRAPTGEWSENDTGITTFDGVSALTATINYSLPVQSSGENDLTGTYALTANGRGTITYTGVNLPFVIWVISPTELVELDTASSIDYLPIVMQFHK